MYPHERSLVKRLESKPFALVGINSDADPLRLKTRMKEENMEIGDTAEHGHEVYPSDVPSLGFPSGIPGLASGAAQAAPTTA